MTRIITLGVLVLCTATAVFAQAAAGRADSETAGQSLIGTVVSITDREIVIRTEAGEVKELARDASTTSDWGRSVRSGDRVEIAYRTDAGGMTALRVTAAAPEGGQGMEEGRMAAAAGREGAMETPAAEEAAAGAETQSQREALPRTGSRSLWYGLMGLTLIGVAFGVRRLRAES